MDRKRSSLSKLARPLTPAIHGADMSTGWWHPLILIDWALAVTIGALSGVISYYARSHQRYDGCLAALNIPLGGRPVDNNTVELNRTSCPENTFDAALGYPNTALQDETVTWWELVLVVFVAPIIVVLGTQVYYGSGRPWNWKHDVHNALKAHLEALALSALPTMIFKNYVGRYRPDYYSLINARNNYAIADGAQSYPSGHSSLSMAMLMTSALYLMGKLQPCVDGRARLYAAILPTIMVMIAFWVACTRVVDYRHNPSDINAGMAIGILASVLSYHMNFAPVWTLRSQIPLLHGNARGARSLSSPRHHLVHADFQDETTPLVNNHRRPSSALKVEG